jgi:hypothetical protein
MYVLSTLRDVNSGNRANGATMVEPINPGETGSSAVAIYVASLSGDLATMARRTGLDTLSYLLEMVRLEAESVARHSGRR